MNELYAQVVAMFLTDVEAMFIEDMTTDDPIYAKAKSVESAFTSGVATLRKAVPNRLIKSLAADIWDVVGKNYVQVAIGPPVPTLSFAALPFLRDGLRATILVPHDWLDQLKEDPMYQLGAIVMCGSQAVDFYNGRFDLEPVQTIIDRAHAYEATLLHTIPPLDPDDDYQRKLMAKYTTVPPELLYDRKPVEEPS